MPRIGIRRRSSDLAVTENRDYGFILADYGFVSDPFIRRFRLERPQPRTVGLDDPGALRRFAAGFPAKDDLAGHPRVRLHVPDPEADIDDELDLSSLKVHSAETAGALTKTRTEPRQKRLARDSWAVSGSVNLKYMEVVVSIETHVAIHLKRRWDRSANACVVGSGFHRV